MTKIKPLKNGVPNLKIGSIYRIFLNYDESRYYFYNHHGSINVIPIRHSQLMTLVNIRIISLMGMHYFGFDFIIADKILTYRVAVEKYGLFDCEFIEVKE